MAAVAIGRGPTGLVCDVIVYNLKTNKWIYDHDRFRLPSNALHVSAAIIFIDSLQKLIGVSSNRKCFYLNIAEISKIECEKWALNFDFSRCWNDFSIAPWRKILGIRSLFVRLQVY